MATSKALLIKLKIPNRVQPEVIPSPGSAGQYTNKMDFLKRYLLDELSKKTFAMDFMQPVDTEALQVPTYYTIIQWPMDIGTINKRLQHRYYHSVAELIRDFRLVISNCYRFNRPEDTVYRNGKKLEKFFHKVLAKLPVGEEFACNHFILTELVPSEYEQATADTERLCRTELKRLQNNYVDNIDTEIREFFKHKWSSLSKKLSKHQFRSPEEFHNQVDGVFLKYSKHAKNIYNNTYNESLEHIEHQKASKELSELLFALKRTVQQYTQPEARWEDSLIVGLDKTVNMLRQQLETYRLEYEEEELESIRDAQLLAEQRRHKERITASQKLHGFRHNLLPDSPKSKNSELQLAHISKAERKEIQQQFIMLPLNSKIEIMQMVACTENINTSDSDLQWFDISNFNNTTLHLMRNAMHPHTKLNLRNMNTSEKVNLQRSLEIRLQSINHALNTSRRKYTNRARFRSVVPSKRQRFSTSVSKDFGSNLELQRKLQAGAEGLTANEQSNFSSDSESDSSSSSSSDSSSESSSEDNKSS